MMLRGLRGSHLRLIARSAMRNGLRGGSGVVFLFLTLITGLAIGSMFISPIEEIQKANESSEFRQFADAMGGRETTTREILDEIVDKIGRPAIQRFTDAGDAQTTYLVQTKPAIVSAIFVVLMFFLPFLISLGSFNQLTGDIAHRGIRYLLLRTERANLFLGRFLGTFYFTVITLAILMAVTLLYMILKADFYPSGDVVIWGLQGLLALVIFSLPYIAFCAWISAGTDSPFVSLVIGQLVIGFYPLLVYLGRQTNEHVKWAGYIMPWAYKYQLLHPSFLHWLFGAGMMMVFTALFLFLGLRTFERRDL